MNCIFGKCVEICIFGKCVERKEGEWEGGREGAGGLAGGRDGWRPGVKTHVKSVRKMRRASHLACGSKDSLLKMVGTIKKESVSGCC